MKKFISIFITILLLMSPNLVEAKRYGDAEFVGTVNLPNGTTLPATCEVGDVFQKTDETASAQDYRCTATNTWTSQGGGAGTGTPGGSNEQIQYNNSGNFAGGQMYYKPITGYVGIGTSAPSTHLQVDGIAEFDGIVLGVNENIAMNGYTIVHDNSLFQFNDDIYAPNIGVATTDPQYELDVNGQIYSSSTITAVGDITSNADVTADGTLYGNSLIFDQTFVGAEGIEGQISWNSTLKTINIDSGDGPIIQAGYEFVGLGYNDTGSTIGDCKVVYANNYSSGLPTGGLAQADVHTTIEGTIAVTTQEVLNGQSGRFTLTGNIDCDTTGLTTGDIIYIDPDNPGGITTTRPTFPDYVMRLGRVAVGNTSNGSIYIAPTSQPIDTLQNFHNGTFREQFDFLVSSDGATITGTMTPSDGHPDMTMIFSDGLSILDTSPGATVTLTAGTDTNPQPNYVYIPQSTKVLTVSTSAFPSTEHIKVAYILLQDEGNTQTYGPFVNQNYNDDVQDTAGNGHLQHIGARIRALGADYENGGEASLTGTPSNVYIGTTTGNVWQMHLQPTDALSMPTDTVFIVNDSSTAYLASSDLGSQFVNDSSGGTLNNKWFSFVVWGSVNKPGDGTQFFINLPSGTYNSESNAVSDALGYSVYDIPSVFKNTGYLIARFTIYKSGTTYTYNSSVGYQDLRGFKPNTTAGAGTGSSGVTTFTGLTDTPSSYSGEAYKISAVNSGESAIDFTADLLNLTSVGIGTTNPTGLLDIEGGDTYLGTSTLNNPSSDEDILVSGNLEVDGTIYGDGSGITGISGSGLWSEGAGTDIYYLNDVGIGTSAPVYDLDVAGTARANSLIVTETGLSVFEDSAGVSVTYKIGVGTSIPNGIADFEGGDVFVGTGTLTNTSASEDLNVTGNLEVDGILYGDGSGLTNTSSQWTTSGSDIYYNTGNVGIGVTDPAGKIETVSTGDTYFDTDTLYIDSSADKVGIGTSTPTYTLDVIGDVSIDGTQILIGDTNNCILKVDDDGTCDSGTAMAVDNSIAICATCAAN